MPTNDEFKQLLGDFIEYDQNARLITMMVDDVDLPWIVERFYGDEGINQPFLWRLNFLIMHANISLNALLGKTARIKLLQADQNVRVFSGIISKVISTGTDGGLARYVFELSPSTHFTQYETNSRIFLDLSVQEITDQIFRNYSGYIDHHWQLSAVLSKRPLTIQNQESNWAFLTRIWSEEGLSYYFKHVQISDHQNDTGLYQEHHDSLTKHNLSGHTLVLVDQYFEWPIVADVEYGRIDATLSHDCICHLSHNQSMQTTQVLRSSWDYKHLYSSSGEISGSGHPNTPQLEDYLAQSAYQFLNQDDARARHKAEIAHMVHLQREHYYFGSGSVRRLQPGDQFTLTAHEDFSTVADTFKQNQLGDEGGRNKLLITSVHHDAVNNIKANLLSHEGTMSEAGTYKNRFSGVRGNTNILSNHLPKPLAMQQTAVVTGLENCLPDANHTERNHRIRVRFHWQQDAPDLNSNDSGSSTWVRVAEWLAGANWGSHFLPRIGDEVLIDFIEGDPDKPVVIGSIYNPEDISPLESGENCNVNHSGTLSGFHSRGIDGADFTQVNHDDAQHQLRLHYKTSYQHSQYNAGYIIHQPQHSSFRGQYRGSGFELHSLGWGVLRSELGLLISTTVRSHGQSGQMDTEEGILQLKTAYQMANKFSQVAAQHGVSAYSHQPHQSSIGHIEHRYSQNIGGQDTHKHTINNRQPIHGAEHYVQPQLHLDSSETLLFSTPSNSLYYAGRDNSQFIQQDWHQSVSNVATNTAGGTFTLYADQSATQGDCIQIKAANGKVSMQAHESTMQIDADQSLHIMSISEGIHLVAQDYIALTAGNSQILLEGPNITFKTLGDIKAISGGQSSASGKSEVGEPQHLPNVD